MTTDPETSGRSDWVDVDPCATSQIGEYIKLALFINNLTKQKSVCVALRAGVSAIAVQLVLI